MKKTWDYYLMDLLKSAKLGSTNDLVTFINVYSPFAAVNEDYSNLIVLRHFKVQFWKDERRVLNSPPDDENFQFGITVVRISEDMNCSKSNFYVPNNLNYTELRIKNAEIEILTDKKTTLTNVLELVRKRKLSLNQSEQDIENSFNSLCNEHYEKPKKIKVKSTTIKLPSFGELIYDKKHEWYEGIFEIENRSFRLNISSVESRKLGHLLSFVSKQLKSKFYEQMLLEMEDKLIALKNDVWLGEDEDTGETEPFITVENFRKRIAIESILFNKDYSAVIYCNDDDIFWGHTIEIGISKNGIYQDVNIVG